MEKDQSPEQIRAAEAETAFVWRVHRLRLPRSIVHFSGSDVYGWVQLLIRIGKLNSVRAARRALVGVTDAVISGQLEPKVANSAIYGLSSVGRLLEAELLERRLADLEERVGVSAALRSAGRHSSRGVAGHA